MPYTIEVYKLFCGGGDVNPVFLMTYTASSETAKITKINLILGPYKFRICDSSNVISGSLSLPTQLAVSLERIEQKNPR